jgi:hypothetical protein
VSELAWRGEGPVFTVDRAGRTWRLALDDPNPCLSWSDDGCRARLLALEHVAAAGRCDATAFTGPSLVSWARHGSRIEATFAPPGWPGLNVRAAWQPTGEAGFDLEVQVWMTLTEVLRRLEIGVGSVWSPVPDRSSKCPAYWVEPRDDQAAALSYDGRESRDFLASLITLPVPADSPHPLDPSLCHFVENSADPPYAEMVQPNDCARRIIGRPAVESSRRVTASWIRYGLFGHDLEKGVVLRGRIRGCWIAASRPEEDARRAYEAFLGEPPPLGP